MSIMRSYQLISAWRLPVHVDTRHQRSVRYWALVLVVSIASFTLYLGVQPWSDTSPLSRDFGPWLKVIGIVLLTGTVFLSGTSHHNIYKCVALVLMVCGVCLFADHLSRFWIHPGLTSFAVGGLIPGNDAGGWLDSTWALLINKELTGMGLRRPLDTSLRVMFLAAFGDLQTSIAMTSLVAALVSLLVAVQIQRSCGWLAAATFFVSALYMISSHLPLVMSEVHGFVFGGIALALLWNSAIKKSISLWFFGLAILSLGLELRPGAFLIAPAVVIFGITTILNREQATLRYLFFGITAMSVGFVCQIITAMYWTGEAITPHPQFAQTLYGMVTGGQGWESAKRDFPNMGTAGWAKESLEIFIQEPSKFLSFYVEELVRFFALFIRYEFGLSRVLTLLLVVWLVWHWREPLARLLLFCGFGIWLSAPFLMLDGGERVFATSFPFLALVPALGVTILVRVVISCVGQGPSPICSSRQELSPPHTTGLRFAMTGLVLLIMLGPVISVNLTNQTAGTKEIGNHLCSDNGQVVIINGRNSAALRIFGDKVLGNERVPNLTRKLFLDALPRDGGDGRDGTIYQEIRLTQPPYTLLKTHDSTTGTGSIFILIKGIVLRNLHEDTALCIYKSSRVKLYFARLIQDK